VDACSEHPNAAARAKCTACGRLLCAGCLELALEGTDQHCGHCHAVATPLVREAPAPTPPPVASATARPRQSIPPAAVVASGGTAAIHEPSELAKVVRYVFAKDTLMVLGALAVITAALRWMAGHSWGPGATIAWIMAAGLEASYYFHIVVDSAGGGEHLEPPDFTSLHEDMVAPLVRYVFTLVPIIASLCWYGELVSHSWRMGIFLFTLQPTSIFDYRGPGILFAAGVALWPLMTAIAAIGRSVIATYNPITWFQTLRLFGTRYIAGAVVFYALLVAEAYVLPVLAPLLEVPVVGLVVIQTVAVIAMALRARARRRVRALLSLI
jgi:hypothetical protein